MTTVSVLRQRMTDDLRIRNYSPNTIRLYIHAVALLARHYKKSPGLLTPEDVRNYLVALVAKKVSVSKLKQVVCAVRFLFRVTLARDFPENLIPYPRSEQRLPVILARQQVIALLSVLTNLKHFAMLTTAYITGLRVSELTHLRVTDIDGQRFVVRVQQGKGRKDREVPIPEALLMLLRSYWTVDRPRPWLFPGKTSDQTISKDAVEKACHCAAVKAGITKHVTPHSLRHAIATHLIEDGVSLQTVQELLGHSDLRTTQRYTHVTTEARKSLRDCLERLMVPLKRTA